ncbi:MAG: glycosyltransferase [Chitinophagaceae bacterium]|nr:glycosyltransferase [Chitinophagaceae bacterium]
MTFPVVSILMTSYNREPFIKESIESVLNSEYGDFELIIVDDCSKDNTVEVARSYEKVDHRVVVYQNESNLGDYPNRNKAASLAKGKYIKYLDSDDLIYPHGLGVMVNSMQQFPNAGFGLSALANAKQPHPYLLSPHDAFLEHFFDYGHFNRAPGSAIILKKAFDQVGGFSGKRMIGDFELWLKLALNYPLVVFPADLYWARTHQGQESQSEYSKLYPKLREEVLNECFSQSNFPLSTEELKVVKESFRQGKFKRVIKKILR